MLYQHAAVGLALTATGAVVSPDSATAALMAVGAGAFLSMLFSARRSARARADGKEGEARIVGGINALIALVGGFAVGLIFMDSLTGVVVMGFENPLDTRANGFTLALFATQLLEMAFDGTFTRAIKSRLTPKGLTDD